MRIAQRYFNQGNSKIFHQDYTGAIVLFDKGIEINPKFAWAYLNRGIAKNLSREGKKSAVDYSKKPAVDQFEQADYSDDGFAETSGAQDHCKLAVVDFDKAIGINPWFAKAYFSRGMIKSGFQTSYRISADSTSYSYRNLSAVNLGTADEKKAAARDGDFRVYMADFDKAIEIDSEFSEAYYTRGLVRSHHQNEHRAIYDLQTLREVDLNLTRTLIMQGLSVGNQNKDYLGAIADFDKAISINPEYADAYYCRGLAKNYLQKPSDKVKGENGTQSKKSTSHSDHKAIDFDGIIADFDMAIKINSKHAKAYCSRGLLKIFAEDFGESWSGQVTIGDPYSFLSGENPKNYTIKNYSGALNDLDKAIEINPKFANAYYVRGVIKFHCHDFAGAIRDCNKAIEIDPAFMEIYLISGHSKNVTGIPAKPGAIKKGQLKSLKVSPKTGI